MKPKEAPKGGSVYQKIHAVTEEAKSVVLDSTARFGPKETPIATLESVLATYKPLCAAHKLVIVPVRPEILTNDFREYTSDYGKKKCERSIVGIYHCKAVDIETGDFHEFAVMTQGLDDGNFAPGKFNAYGLKYAYLQLFSGERGEDPDIGGSGNGHAKEEVKQESKEPVKEDAEDKAAHKRKLFTDAYKLIKDKYPIKEFADSGKSAPPYAKVYKPAVDAIIGKVNDAEVRKHLSDVALFHWHAIFIAVGKDLPKTRKIVEAAKDKHTKENFKLLMDMLGKREAAEMEPAKESTYE